jgi:hypothetical protein
MNIRRHYVNCQPQKNVMEAVSNADTDIIGEEL